MEEDNTLALLDIGENNIELRDMIVNKIDVENIVNKKFNERLDNTKEIVKASDKANKIANETLNLLLKDFLGKI